jgi:hypothetical protein
VRIFFIFYAIKKVKKIWWCKFIVIDLHHYKNTTMKIQELIDQLKALNKPNADIVLLGNTGNPEDEDTDMYFDKLEVWNDGEDSITIFVGLNEK